MAIEELSELLEEANVPVSNITSAPILIPQGYAAIVSTEYPNADPLLPRYPDDLVEIQELGERPQGDTGAFHLLTKREFPIILPMTNSLLYWTWEFQVVKFNRASAPIEVQLKYICQGVPYVAGPNTLITMINSRAYLSYKTAALCSFFIGENESRAKVLNDHADLAMERIEGISNKGRQQIMTRHRPFRATYKTRSGF